MLDRLFRLLAEPLVLLLVLTLVALLAVWAGVATDSFAKDGKW